ncbi:glutaminyl-peptide cyclotransferase [Stagnimonas aquatica]|uniref:Glutaminyl-peptide cyclotransferase n=1 Tax=Stagnimonas aquatica TaxID=2689987 RepID=A0A3N0VG27_9GAMM|nr:glutaminyl-peptide cyclotransferase [Stagnimonas aquatica]ROH91707.1 glutaminyl-peptide cyclotransferase [Stagnimonas aquatica]
MTHTRSKIHRLVARIVALGLLLTFGAAQAAAPTLKWQLVASHPHEASDFTQGLVWHQGRLFESAGQYGASRIAEKELSSGKTLRNTTLPGNEFAEGLALIQGQLWQLTWREGVAHVYDLDLQPLKRLRYGGEGWGLASDGQQLVVSDGSSRLYFVDPEGFRLRRSIEVSDDGQPVPMLNELEWFEGAIYANVWMTDRVARIDPASGQVTGWLDFAPLKRAAGISADQEARGAVLNGLAWRAEKRHLLVTGKWWPQLFELKLDGIGATK